MYILSEDWFYFECIRDNTKIFFHGIERASRRGITIHEIEYMIARKKNYTREATADTSRWYKEEPQVHVRAEHHCLLRTR